MKSKVHAQAMTSNGVLAVLVGLVPLCAVTSSHGQLCGGASWWGSITIPPPGPSGQVRGIAAGSNHVVFLTEPGFQEVQCFGSNSWGQCDVPSLPGAVRQVAAGLDHSLALLADGTVVCWGRSNEGECDVPAALPPALAIGAGRRSLAILPGGTVVSWGPAGAGTLAGVTNAVKVDGGYQFDAAMRANGELFVSGVPGPVIVGLRNFDVGYDHVVGLRSDGSVECWANDAGQRCALLQPPSGLAAKAVAAGTGFSLAVDVDGMVVQWGCRPPMQSPPGILAETVHANLEQFPWWFAPPGAPGCGPQAASVFGIAGTCPTADTSIDCDRDGVADPNQFAAEPWLDCNANGWLDGCDDTGGSGPGALRWTAVGGGEFQSGASWCFASPTSTSSISFPYSPSYGVGFSQNRTVRNMQVGGGFPTLNLAGKTLMLSNPAQPAQAFLRIGTVEGTPATLGVLSGTVSAAFTEVGHAAGSTGNLVVGAGGISVSTQEICVGCEGAGDMKVVGGGRVVSQKGVIGETVGGPGAVLVEGVPPSTGNGTGAIESIWDSTLGIDVRNGVLRVGAHGVINSPAVGVVLYSGGVLQGTGRINGTVTNFGSAAGNCGTASSMGAGAACQGGVIPGGSAANAESLHGAPTIGTLTINGVYQQIESNPLLGTNSGSLLIEVMPGADGPQHDKLVVNGTASLGGGLFVDFPAGDPGTFDSLPIVTASNVDPNRDMFDVAVMPGLPDGRFVKVDPVQGLKGGSAGISISVSTLNELLGFGDPSSSGVPRVPLAAAVADLDGKNGPDLAITTRGLTPLGPGSLFILFNDGNGGLEQAIQWPGLLGVEPVDIVAAQLRTNSSLIDLAVVNKGDNTLQYLENQGGGVFTSLGTTSTGLGSAPVAIAAASIYSPSNLAGAAKDLIVANSATNEVAVFKVLGNFPWSIPIFLPAPIEPTDVDGVDIDNNRTIDIIVSAKRSSLIKSFQFDSKTQTFDDGFEFLTGEGPASLVIADLDGDGRPDVTTVNNGQLSDSVSVLINRTAAGGLVNFAPAVNLPTGGDPVSVVAGDFDLDTQPGQAPDLDLAFTARATSAPNAPRVVKILRNDRQNGVLVLAPAEDQIVPGSPRIVLAAEMDPAPGVDLVTVADGGAAGVQLQGSVANAAVRPAVRRQKPCLPGDVNCDGTVDGNDLATLLAAWGTANAAADFNQDGIVSADDLAVLLANWGAGQS